ncbi:putative hydrolase of the HAD superfamily [Desulfonauticus submarinus]|uniref:Putative hydrolase of the HAD superfamily n=1 Tax=Desulfonauticus submarinus TaxID=206665 RepID=A0A1H0DTQ6_9BACT|nr:HAD family hydrolase [Desulfonauticus submarinus]SDN73458.1 putative hydrolase of the HAD superfamily [Desulfonauticus submarinus]
MEINSLKDLILKNSKPLIPLKVDSSLLPDIQQINFKGIKAVIFDVYGTILISGAGDIGCEVKCVDALYNTFKFFKIKNISFTKEKLWNIFYDIILNDHQQKKEKGILYPEVNILEIWELFLDRISIQLNRKEIQKFTLYYELAVNPCWPMPDLIDVLIWLKQKGIRLGIISNAQFYTPLILETLLGKDLQSLGFSLDMCVWSYLEGRAKPDIFLFEKLEKVLDNCSPEEILYIGNDRLKDIWPAFLRGWKTILFAGDKRSFRWRGNLKKLANCRPNGLILKLSQIKSIL